MIWRSRILLFLAITLTFFVSCTPRGQNPNPGTSPESPLHPPNSEGTVDSGGGNTFMGKPLEAYVVDVRRLQAFDDFIRPIIESNALQGSRLKNAFDSIIDKKSWYFVPSELKQLPSEKIASAVGADQAALQDFKQVWVNKNIFDKMSQQDQAILIVHEMLMGLRLLRFDSNLNECLAFQTEKDKDSFCQNSYSREIRGKPSDLSVADYAQIRAAAKKIMEAGSNFSLQDWEDLLGSEGFSTEAYPFIPKSSKKVFPLEKLGRMVQTSKLTQSWPTFGYDFNKFIQDHTEMLTPGSKPPKMIWKSDLKCNFDLNISSDSFSISLAEGLNQKIYSTRWTREIESSLMRDAFDGRYFYEITTPPLKMRDTSKQGNEVLFVTLKFLDEFLQSADLEKAVCLDSECHNTSARPDSFKVMCYTRSSLNLFSK
jgi:hypothetical protein